MSRLGLVKSTYGGEVRNVESKVIRRQLRKHFEIRRQPLFTVHAHGNEKIVAKMSEGGMQD